VGAAKAAPKYKEDSDSEEAESESEDEASDYAPSD
jgi:U3 small nucleolar RNA-associated protein 14